ncbi:MAG: DUF11 domain-containing protein [Methanoregula sp.]|nr:DUF11 domain-containing protein [Methanoregula sp.]
MTKYRFVKGAILLALVLMVTVVSAATALSDLNVTKEVTSAGPYEPGDDVEWLVTVWNNGPDDASDIDVVEDISDLTDLDTMDVTPDSGTTYDDATDTWTIPELPNDASAQLMVVTNFTTAGEKTNTVTIADRGQDDLVTTDNSAVMTVIINEAAPVIYDVDLKIKPTTLNLKSKGVFTVFVTVGSLSPESEEDEEETDEAGKPEIDFDESTLTCSEAELIRASVSNKDGGTLIAKFYRQDLLNVTNGTGVLINCSGTLVINGETYNVEGSDTIRVLGDKKGLAKILSDVKKFLRLENDEVEVNETENSTATATVTLNPESYKNKGQEKKVTRNSGDVSTTTTGSSPSDTNRGPKEKEPKNTGSNKNIQENTGGDTTGRGNGNANKPAESPGQSNGKKNK